MSVFRGGQCCVEKGLWIKATVFHPISRLLSVEWVTLRYLNIEYTLSSSIVRYSCREMLQNSIWNPILLYTLFVLHGILCDLSAPMVLKVYWTSVTEVKCFFLSTKIGHLAYCFFVRANCPLYREVFSIKSWNSLKDCKYMVLMFDNNCFFFSLVQSQFAAVEIKWNLRRNLRLMGWSEFTTRLQIKGAKPHYSLSFFPSIKFPKKIGTVFLFNAIFRHWNVFVWAVATDGKDGHQLKLGKVGATFSSFKTMPAKMTTTLLWLVLPVTCVSSAKRGGGVGREKSAKEGKREGKLLNDRRNFDLPKLMPVEQISLMPSSCLSLTNTHQGARYSSWVSQSGICGRQRPQQWTKGASYSRRSLPSLPNPPLLSLPPYPHPFRCLLHRLLLPGEICLICSSQLYNSILCMVKALMNDSAQSWPKPEISSWPSLFKHKGGIFSTIQSRVFWCSKNNPLRMWTMIKSLKEASTSEHREALWKEPQSEAT